MKAIFTFIPFIFLHMVIPKISDEKSNKRVTEIIQTNGNKELKIKYIFLKFVS